MEKSTASFTFNKHEKLKSRKLTEQLFKSSQSFLVFPIKVVYLIIDKTNNEKFIEDGASIKIGVSVSSKKFKHAVDRNRIKRLLREHYRLNKAPLHEAIQLSDKKIAVFFMYIDKALPTNEVLHKKMPQAINKLITIIHEGNQTSL